jgi:plasmid replication initiation protein
MKYNTPKELWNLYKELQAFNKKKQDQEKIEQVVFDLICAHLKEKEIRYCSEVKFITTEIEKNCAFCR